MSEKNQPSPENQARRKLPISFMTQKGSVYTYQEDGRVTRFKAVEAKHYPEQDVTIFVTLSDEDFSQYSDTAYKHLPGNNGLAREYLEYIKNRSIYIFQRLPDGGGEIVDSLDDIHDPAALNIGIIDGDPADGGELVLLHEASLYPTLGARVIELSHHDVGNGLERFYHLGHEVASVQE